MEIVVALYISLVAAVLPTLLYAAIFYWADRYEREPGLLIAAAFFWGAIPAIIASIIGEILLGTSLVNEPNSLSGALVEGALIAPFVEEVFKGIALLGIFYLWRQEFDGVLDGLIYGALVGFGFAMTENFLYFIGAFDEGGFGNLTVVIFLRAIIFGLNHAFYTGLMGIGFGFARNASRPSTRILWMVAGFLAAFLTHSLHNLGVGLVEINFLGVFLSLVVAGLGFALVVIAILLAWQHERTYIQQELAAEVGHLISQQDFDLLTGYWRQPFFRKQANYMQQYVEYAARKHRLRRFGDEKEPELTAEIAELRRQSRWLSSAC